MKNDDVVELLDIETMLQVLDEFPPTKTPTLVFCNTVGGAQSLHAYLTSQPSLENAKIGLLHGRIPSKDRRTILSSFIQAHTHMLITTDILSRGINTVNAEHVILYDFPTNPVDYLHRVGRAARRSAGKATSFIGKHDRQLMEKIQSCIKQKIPIS